MRVAEREELSKSIIKTNLKNINSTGQGNFMFVGKSQGKVREFQKPLAVATMPGLTSQI